MIDANMIQNLPVDNRKQLVNYVEGLPSTLNKYVKMVLLESYMDPSFFNSRTRRVHKYSTLGKYLGKNNIIQEKSFQNADYQKEYSASMEWIYGKDNDFDKKIKYNLETLLNAECYDIETLIKAEVFIGSFLGDLESNRTIMARPEVLYAVAKGITYNIMKYKLNAYDFYNYLNMGKEIQLQEEDFHHVSKINDMINNLIKNGPGLTSFNDIGVLIYIYMKYLGIEKHIQKYNLFARFKYTMKFFNISDSNIEDVLNRIMECENTQMSTTSASSLLVNSAKLARMDKDKFSNIEPMTGTANIDEENGFIFTFKNIKDYDPDVLGELSVNLRALNTPEILHYTDIAPENLTYELNANDIGHIRNENGINLGTIYNSFDEEMKYIIEYEGEFFLLFKNRMNTRTVYGISIKKYPSTESVSRPRKLIVIKESLQFGYEFISDL